MTNVETNEKSSEQTEVEAAPAKTAEESAAATESDVSKENKEACIAPEIPAETQTMSEQPKPPEKAAAEQGSAPPYKPPRPPSSASINPAVAAAVAAFSTAPPVAATTTAPSTVPAPTSTTNTSPDDTMTPPNAEIAASNTQFVIPAMPPPPPTSSQASSRRPSSTDDITVVTSHRHSLDEQIRQYLPAGYHLDGDTDDSTVPSRPESDGHALHSDEEEDASTTISGTGKRKSRRFYYSAAIALLLVAAAGGLAVALVFLLGDKDDNNTNDAASPGSSSPGGPFAPSPSPTSNNNNNIDSTFTWSQVGPSILGSAISDETGFAVALSSDGRTVAMGAPYHDDVALGNNVGQVRVFRLANDDDQWSLLGQEILGEAAEDLWGVSVALSANGQVMAAGAIWNDGTGRLAGHVRVMEYTNDQVGWTQLGQDIDGEAIDDFFGHSVSLSDDGRTVAIGGFWNDGAGLNAGHVRVLQLESSEWVQLGKDLDGQEEKDYFGTSVSLSQDGRTVAVGAIARDDDNQGNTGYVRVLRYIAGNWVQMGPDLQGDADGDAFGRSVSLSANGRKLAVGANTNDNQNGVDAGLVRVLEWVNNVWVPIGQDILGEAAGDEAGFSVSLSAEGDTVAVGNGNRKDTGHLRIFRLVGQTWTQLGVSLEGQGKFDNFGHSVSLSADGTSVAVGARYNSDNGHRSGNVRVFELQDTE